MKSSYWSTLTLSSVAKFVYRPLNMKTTYNGYCSLKLHFVSLRA